jgi:hypothetical protein
MTMNRNGIQDFFRSYQAQAVGNTPPQPNIPIEDEETAPSLDWNIETTADAWNPILVPEAPAREGEYPTRFIDGSQTGQPVLCLRSPQGWPIPLLLSEVGAVGLRSKGKSLERDFALVERVLSFVADPFPWAKVEAFSEDLLNRPELGLRILPANRPNEKHSPFDYEVMRSQARTRVQQEMTSLERLALAVAPELPTLVDGPLSRVMAYPNRQTPLRVGIVKQQSANLLHDRGWQVLLQLPPAHRTPVFRFESKGLESKFPVAAWFLKLTAGENLAPNWGYVRVEVPWREYELRDKNERKGFVNRLSRWLIDARCRTESYARMPVSLEPIVRAEDALKPLFSNMPVLVNRLYRSAGLFRGNEG